MPRHIEKMTDDKYLDYLCEFTSSPAALNALHACRAGHPLGAGNAYKWRNAYSIARVKRDFMSTNLTRLASRTNKEATP